MVKEISDPFTKYNHATCCQIIIARKGPPFLLFLFMCSPTSAPLNSFIYVFQKSVRGLSVSSMLSQVIAPKSFFHYTLVVIFKNISILCYFPSICSQDCHCIQEVSSMNQGKIVVSLWFNPLTVNTCTSF